MAGMTFLEFLKYRRPTYTAQGVFTSEALVDPNLPNASSWPELQAYLSHKGLPPASLVAAQAVWDAYEAFKRQKKTTAGNRR